MNCEVRGYLPHGTYILVKIGKLIQFLKMSFSVPYYLVEQEAHGPHRSPEKPEFKSRNTFE